MYVITGGGSGIGQALAISLANKGLEVLVIGRRETHLQITARHSDNISYYVANLTSEKDCLGLIDYLQEKKITGLVHNAGTISPIEKIETVNLQEWIRLIELNLFAPLHLTQKLLPQLKGGRILHIGSGAAYFPVEGWSAYCVSKAALSMLTRCMQLEINDPVIASVMPGIVDTDMTQRIRISTGMSEVQQNFHQKLYQEHRLVTTETVAQFLTWLLIETSRSVFISQEWDIYDVSHHQKWLSDENSVPSLS